VEQIRPELVSHPQVALVVAAHRLDVEIGARKKPVARLLVHDREAHVPEGVTKLDMVPDSDGPRDELAAPEVRPQPVEAQQEVRGVLLPAVAVVREGEVRPAPASADDAREALHGLGREGRHPAVDRRSAQCRPGRRSRRERVRGKHSSRFERGGRHRLRRLPDRGRGRG
jgi:hypothetical protein